MTRIVQTASAKRDIFSIAEYIAVDNISAAVSWIEELDKTLHSLARSPLIGERVDHLAVGVRRYCFGNYLLFYKSLEDGVELRRVLHGARRLDELS